MLLRFCRHPLERAGKNEHRLTLKIAISRRLVSVPTCLAGFPRMTEIGASSPFPRSPAKVPSPNDQQTLSAAARTAIACDRPARNCGGRCLVDDECVRVGADAGIIVERRQRDAIERHGARVGLCAA